MNIRQVYILDKVENNPVQINGHPGQSSVEIALWRGLRRSMILTGLRIEYCSLGRRIRYYEQHLPYPGGDHKHLLRWRQRLGGEWSSAGSSVHARSRSAQQGY